MQTSSGPGTPGGALGNGDADGASMPQGTQVLQQLRGTAARLHSSGMLPNSASADGWAFGWKLYAAEQRPAENLFLSPYSISTAVAMLVAGAAGGTKAGIDTALDFSSDGDDFHAARNAVAIALAGRNRNIGKPNAQTVRVSNGLWLAPGFDPTQPFLDTLSSYYGAGVSRAPFATDPDTARAAINAQIAQDTSQLIPELMPRGSVDDATLLVLTNALYFKSSWAEAFDAPQPGPFQAENGTTSNVPLMRNELLAKYFEGPDYQAIALPYEQDELELVAIMPAAGTFDQFVSGLSANQVTSVVAQLQPDDLDVTFPSFNITHQTPLTQRLIDFGMQAAFSSNADFSGISPGLQLSGAFHQATISVDEHGTEAAAATAIVAEAVSARTIHINLVFDHPFVFFIRDVETNALLFVGHYANP